MSAFEAGQHLTSFLDKEIGNVANVPNTLIHAGHWASICTLGISCAHCGQQRSRAILDTWVPMPTDAVHELIWRWEDDDVGKSIVERFSAQVQRYPDRLAIKSADGLKLTYRELDKLSNTVAHEILARDNSDAPVAFLLDQSSTAAVTILGILKAARIFVALDPSWAPPELNRILADCRPGLVLTDSKHFDRVGRLTHGYQCVNLDAVGSGAPDSPLECTIKPDDLAYIYYTSGSTGAAKGVCDSHRNVLHNIYRYTNNLHITCHDRLSLIQACAFSGTVSSLFGALLNGASAFPFDLKGLGMKRLARWVDDEKLTIFHSVPMIFEQMLETSADFTGLRLIRLEGDQASSRHIAAFQRRFGPNCTLVNGLGTTETGIVRQYFVDPGTVVPPGAVPIGYPVRDMDIRLLDDEGREVPGGTVGEISVCSRYLAVGYWGKPVLTAQSFRQDAEDSTRRIYRTGDLGRMLPGGCLQYLGRKDFRIKLRGERIEIAQVEDALRALPGVRQAAAMVREDKPGRQQLVAYVVASECRPEVRTLRKSLLAKLHRTMVPTRFAFLDELPLDDNQKVRRDRLPPPVNSPLPRRASIAGSKQQRLLLRCFMEVLEQCDVGLHDNFFDFGGDSLQAAELALLIERRLLVPCPPEFPFEVGSVFELDRLMGSARPVTLATTLQGSGNAIPLFIIHRSRGYRDLAEMLAPDHPVVAIERATFNDLLGKDRVVESLARGYALEIMRIQRKGPYQLCGNCSEGVVAFEVARQLIAAGGEVSFLGLIDTAFPGSRNTPRSGKVGEMAHAARGLSRRLRVLLHRGARILAPDSPVVTGFLDRQFRRDFQRYRPVPLTIPATLFCFGKPHNHVGWVTLSNGRIEVVSLPEPPGDKVLPLPHIIDRPHVTGLAAEIQKRLSASGSMD
ncbi:AMP-binding protein [Mesorhizobium sp. 10J20-29]